MRVLAVDDDPLVLMSTTMMLEELGHEVVETTSGLRALDELQGGEFDLVVTDVMMPGMNGFELMEEIASRNPGFPVLLVSGFTNLPPGVQLQVPLLSKPFGIAQLAAAIGRVIVDRRMAAA